MRKKKKKIYIYIYIYCNLLGSISYTNALLTANTDESQLIRVAPSF